jgi:acetyltransferase-like isoleucine patch superfamily enzyme
MPIRKHPTAEVQTHQIGEDTVIWQYCVILKGAKIGRNCNINFNVFIENDVIVGDNVTVKPGVQLWDGLRIGNNVFIGPNATFTNDLYPRSKQYPDSFERTIIEEGVTIGANATILAGVTIGKYAMVGAGSLLTKCVSPFTLWYGNPAIQKGYITRLGKVLTMALKDREGKQYSLVNYEPVYND